MSWRKIQSDLHVLGQSIQEDVYLESDINYWEIYCMPVAINSGGAIRYFSSGTAHVYGYLSSNNSFDTDTGIPTDLIMSDTPSSGNFNITYTLEPGTYYFWCRLWHELASGSFSINVLNTSSSGQEEGGGGSSGGGGSGGGEVYPPETIGGWNVITTDLSNSPLYGNYTESVYLNGDDVRCIKCRFDTAGEAVFYTEGSTDTCGYVSFTNEFDQDRGAPAVPVRYNNNYNGDVNFRIAMSVEANTTYYFWYKCITWSGGCTVHIDPPSTRWQAKREMNIGIYDYAQINYISFNAGEIQEITFYANDDGRVSFFAYGGVEGEQDVEVVGFVTMENNNSFDPSTGIPYGTENLEDFSISGDGNYFLYHIQVVHNYTYHLWIRPSSGSASGTVAVEVSSLRHIEWSLDGHRYSPAVLEYNEVYNYQQELSEFVMGYVPVVFESSGAAKFQILSTSYIQGCVGYITTANSDYTYDWEYCDLYDGVPLHPLYTATNQSGRDGLEIECNVTAGTEYYFWYKCFRYGESGGTFDIQIISPNDGNPGQGGEDTPWTLQPRTVPDPISSLFYGSVQMEQFDLYRVAVRFTYSGTVDFYTTGNLSTCGYIGDNNEYNLYTGAPLRYMYADTHLGEHRNLNISFTARAGTTYYFWFRCAAGTDSGNLVLYIDPPTSPSGGGSDSGSVTCYIYHNGSWHSATPYVYDGTQWRQATPHIFV